MSMTLKEARAAYRERFDGSPLYYSMDMSDESHVELMEMALERGTPLTLEDYEARESDVPPDACS